MILLILLLGLFGCQQKDTPARAQNSPTLTPHVQSTTQDWHPTPREEPTEEIKANKTVEDRLDLLEGQINWMKQRLPKATASPPE